MVISMLQITMEISAPIRRIFLEIQTTKIILGQLERIQKMFLGIRPTKTIGALVAHILRMFSETQTYPSLKRLQSNEAKRKPRTKRVAGCEPTGGAQ